MNPWESASAGLNSFNNSMLTLAQLKRQDAEDSQRSKLIGLQTEAAQQGVDQNKLTLQDLRAKQGALIDQYGTAGHTDPLASAYAFQNQEAQDAQALERKQKGFEVYLNTIKAIDALKTLAPKSKTEINKHLLAQNPEYAQFAANMTYIDPQGVKAAKMYKEGELTDPVTKQPLPAGYYETEGRWTGDAANPVQLVSYKQAEPPKADEHETWGEPEKMTVGGKTAMVQKSNRGQIRPVIQDTAPRITVKTTGGGGGGRPMPTSKPPVGYRYTADGELEPIPGGPASQKVVTAAKSQEGAVQSIGTAIDAAKSLLNHPGRTAATGGSSLFNAAAVPGGARKTFLNDLETFKSQMFIPMVQQMKGMGQLSDAEGKKLLAAVGNLETTSSEAAFVSNLNKVIQGLEQTLARTSQPIAAGPNGKQPARNAAKPKNAGYSDLLNKYRK